MPHYIIGTAGHIDHGKTALVKALTGVDTDRLKEEKARGLTIDLGFAHLGDEATIIDVPGHERFIRNMVAGVSTIDLVLFVVAADDGIMPQTREHLDILRILQIRHGIIVITKADLVDEEWRGLVKDDIAALTKDTFLENAPVIAVSALTGAGIPELQGLIERQLQIVKAKEDRGVFWMPIDRSFSMKGFGAVVTGSVLSGETRVGGSLHLLPDGALVKVRAIQAHNHQVDSVRPGDRAAINLQAIEKNKVHRGDVLAEAGYFNPSRRFDAKLRLLKSAPRELRSNARIRLHIGTAEVMARIAFFGVKRLEPGEWAYIQLHLERPAAARRLDPFLIRQYSPTLTIGGGIILDGNAPRRKLSDSQVLAVFEALEKASPVEVLEKKLLVNGLAVSTLEELSSELTIARQELDSLLEKLSRKVRILKKDGKPAVIHANHFERFCERICEVLGGFHQANPARPGLPKVELVKQLGQYIADSLVDDAVSELKRQGLLREQASVLSLAQHRSSLSADQQALKEMVARTLLEEGFATSTPEELGARFKNTPGAVREIIDYLLDTGTVIRLEGDIYFHTERVMEAREKLVAFLREHQEITVSQFKDLVGGASRKYSLPLLIYFDGIGVTERVDNVRILSVD